jgi:hypothetical protein
LKQKIFEIDKITDIADYVKNSLSDSPIIIIGERHHNGTDRMLQKEVMEVIKNFKPKNFLYELMHSAIYDPNKHEITFRDDKEKNDPVDDAEEFKTWEDGFYYNIARNYKVKIIGCDLPVYLWKISELGKDEIKENNPIREKKMGEIITEYSKPFEPLIVVLGNDHVKDTSNIYNFINSDYISICIDDICYKCKREVIDQHQDVCQNCNAIRTRKIKTISLK